MQCETIIEKLIFLWRLKKKWQKVVGAAKRQKVNWTFKGEIYSRTQEQVQDRTYNQIDNSIVC